jgi:hypothetical protein
MRSTSTPFQVSGDVLALQLAKLQKVVRETKNSTKVQAD